MSVTQTYVSIAQNIEGNYDLAEFLGNRIIAEEAAGANRYLTFLKYAWEYRDAMLGIYEVMTDDSYPEGFQEAAVFIIVASVMGRFINTDGAISLLNDAANILKTYEASLTDLAQRFPDLISYDSQTETLSFPWNPGNTPIDELDPPEPHVPIAGVSPPTLEDIPTPADRSEGAYVPDITQPFEQSEQTISPLVLDLAGTGINLAALGGAGSVYWNITEGDFAHASGWIAEGSGLLAIDLNEDGIINDHSELFGTGETDGFTVLSAYDSNSDNAITSADDDWDKLLVWIDANGDGYS